MPIITYVNELDKEALKRILVEPKNAIIKQYVKLFEKEKALEQVLAQIEKDFGKGAVMRLGENVTMNVEKISTGGVFLKLSERTAKIPLKHKRSSADMLNSRKTPAA